jgi:eukaryotic-like serine/threonine-protein kinase
MAESLEWVLLDGRYRVGAVIGRGGMSDVYDAQDLRLGRRVAIKIMRGGDADAAAERLFREARAAARAEHPAVVTVFGYGSDDSLGVDYLVMERLQGEDLATRIARVGRLPCPVVVELGVEVADALAHVHGAGVLHRDIKPANVFLASRGMRVDEVKLLDFGVAKHLDMHTLTAPGQVLGSLRYMAAEQFGDPKLVDGRCDVYALGVTLYESLCAASPYSDGAAMELAAEILNGQRTPLARRAPEVPGAMCAVVERCLMPRPADRFSSARALCNALIEVRSRIA